MSGLYRKKIEKGIRYINTIIPYFSDSDYFPSNITPFNSQCSLILCHISSIPSLLDVKLILVTITVASNLTFCFIINPFFPYRVEPLLDLPLLIFSLLSNVLPIGGFFPYLYHQYLSMLLFIYSCFQSL